MAAACLLHVPVHKTGAVFAKPVDAVMGQADAAWEAPRPDQPPRLDAMTGEVVDFLFCYQARRLRTAYLNPTMGTYRVGLNGKNEYEFFEPIRVGDVLTVLPRLISVEEKLRDDGGVLLVIRIGADVFNQLGETVVTLRQTLLRINAPDQVRSEATV